MTDPDPIPRGMAALLDDWVTICQSEMAALLVDRELLETRQRMVEAWATQARIVAQTLGAALDRTPGHASPRPPPRPTPPGAPPDGRDAVIAELLRRVAELERRLAPPP